MRRISLEQSPLQMPVNTFLGYGDTRSGKTTFAATFPRPYIIVDAIESGYKSILNMDRSTWFESDVEPMLVAPENMSDVATQIAPELEALIARKRVLSIVFDAFSFYTDFFLAGLYRAMGASKDKDPDTRQIYGKLGIHLRELRTIMHSKGVNVFWGCLAKHPDEADKKGRPLIPGQQSDKFSAGVDFLWHFVERREITGPKSFQTHYDIHTRPNGAYIAGHREGQYADNLPAVFTDATYANVLTVLGYDADQVRTNLPKILPAAPVAKPAAPPAKLAVVAPKATPPVQRVITVPQAKR